MSSAYYHLALNVDDYRPSFRRVRHRDGIMLTPGVGGVELTLETETFVIDSAGATFDAAAVDALRCLADAIESGARGHGMASVVEIKRREPVEARKI